MQTHFTPEQLKDPQTSRANEILRACVHCGFCTATCPSYQVLGNELDSPRGRIYLIKEMIETERTPDAKTVKHIDRCLGCLACMSTCPSGVHYMHLLDHARDYIEQHYKRPLSDRLLRWLLLRILPYPMRFRLALLGARMLRPVAQAIPAPRIRAMLSMAPKTIPPVSRNDDPQCFATPGTRGARKMRLALMTGCAQRALNTDINDATIRLLTRLGCEVVISKNLGCCGALAHHLGHHHDSHTAAARNIMAWAEEGERDGLDGIIINTSGCGTTVKDYGYMFRADPDPAMAAKAATVSGLAMDITEALMKLEFPKTAAPQNLRVAYHAACSLQHGQQVTSPPKELLRRAGFHILEPTDPHLCCGSAGTYNLLQPEISGQLKTRKIATLTATRPDVIAAGNIGCMMQIASGTDIPVVHTVELLDWATGGPKPPSMG